MNRWTLTDEAKAQIPEWNERWIKTIMSTDPIDFEKTSFAVRGMCRAANLPEPRIVHVLSPMMAAIVGACAGAYWNYRSATAASTYASTAASTAARTAASTSASTAASTDASTYDSTYDSTYASTAASTRASTHASTHARTYASTAASTDARTDARTDDRTDARTRASTYASEVARVMWMAAISVVNEKAGVDLTKSAESLLRRWYDFYNGGSEWASWCCYLSFVRDVVGWSHPSHENYAHYENAAIYGGPRYMHRAFVLLSERAAERHTEDNVLHCEIGPAISWHCGTTGWYIHGVRVDEQIVMRPESQTIEQLKSESNEEVRRVRIDRFGWERFITESGATLRHKRRNERDQQFEQLFVLDDGTQRIKLVDPSTGRKYFLGVPREIDTCQGAQDFISHNLDQYATHRS